MKTYTIEETLELIRRNSRNGNNNPELNHICWNCLTYGNGCNGTTCQTWTGCIYRKTK